MCEYEYHRAYRSKHQLHSNEIMLFSLPWQRAGLLQWLLAGMTAPIIERQLFWFQMVDTLCTSLRRAGFRISVVVARRHVAPRVITAA